MLLGTAFSIHDCDSATHLAMAGQACDIWDQKETNVLHDGQCFLVKRHIAW
jgi:hypothetical protein